MVKSMWQNGKLPELELIHRAKGHREIQVNKPFKRRFCSLDRHEPKP
jgi:hypothetical protein